MGQVLHKTSSGGLEMYILINRNFGSVAINIAKILEAQDLLNIDTPMILIRSVGEKTWVRMSDQASSDSLMKAMKIWGPTTVATEEEANAWLIK